MNEILQRLCRIGIVPVLSVEDAEKALGLANALSAGGLPAAEVTSAPRRGRSLSARSQRIARRFWWGRAQF